MTRSSKITFLPAMALVLFSGCTEEVEKLERHTDLVQLASIARVSFEVPPVQPESIQFASPDARAHLVSGWSEPKKGRPGKSWVESTGARSTLSFVVREARAVDVEIHCRASGVSRNHSPTITVELNGKRVAATVVTGRLHSYRFALPSTGLRRGENSLSFAYGPAENPPTILWHRLEFVPPAELLPAVDAEGSRLFLSYGTRADFYVHLPEKAVLSFDNVSFRGGDESSLSVSVEADRDESIKRARYERNRQRTEIPIGVRSSPFVQITLSAASAGGGKEGAGVLLSAPTLWTFRRTPRLEPGRDGATAFAEPLPEAGPRPNILIYLMDTLRADHLGSYGYSKQISPHIDAFADGATLFENAIGQSSWTRAAVASVLTGLWPGTHRAIGRRDRLASEAVTLAEILQATGYATGAFLTQPNLDRRFGLDQGYDVYEQLSDTADSEAVGQKVLEWLSDRDHGSSPFFAYVHTLDPHAPYLPPDNYRRRLAPGTDQLVAQIEREPYLKNWPATGEMVEQLEALYDAEVAFNDASFGALIEELENQGLYEDTVVVLLSDHGEEFQDHGAWAHASELYAETLNFAFILKLPRQREGRRVSQVVQHIDLLPTLLDLLGLEAPVPVEGRSLMPLLETESGGGSTDSPFIYSHLHLEGPLMLSVVAGDWKLIERRIAENLVHHELYNWRKDPAESRNLAPVRPIIVGALHTLLEQKLARQTETLAPGQAELDEELEESLRALGYL